ncbi:hypothetical protein [Pontiella sp.]|uniref:hypothetical protein n=1 Tax=Pontiella sp. TaxID=2837462 RepID=UPI0035665652
MRYYKTKLLILACLLFGNYELRADQILDRKIESIIKSAEHPENSLVAGYPYSYSDGVSLINVLEQTYLRETGKMFHTLNRNERNEYIKSRITNDAYNRLKDVCTSRIERSLAKSELDAAAMLFLAMHLSDDSMLKEIQPAFFEFNKFERLALVCSLSISDDVDVNELLSMYYSEVEEFGSIRPESILFCMRYARSPELNSVLEKTQIDNSYLKMEQIKYNYPFDSESEYVVEALTQIFDGDEDKYELFKLIVDVLIQRRERILSGTIKGYEEIDNYTPMFKKLCGRERYAASSIKYLASIGDLQGVEAIVEASEISRPIKQVLLRAAKGE